MPPRRRRHGLELGLILLLNELLQFGMRNIPPVTLSTVLGQTLLYMGLINVPWEKEEVCISAQAVLGNKDWKRIILSAFEHGDDMHLYYNMASFLIKGRSLEKRYGSKNFGLVLCFLTVLTGCMYVFLAQLMSEIMESKSYMNSCAIGFSGVIFALKVLTTHEEPAIKATLIGIQIPGKYAAWVELIIIHMLVANSSFMGHLAGILAGIIYCKTFVGSIADKIFHCLTGDAIVHGGEQSQQTRNSYNQEYYNNDRPNEFEYETQNLNNWNARYFQQFDRNEYQDDFYGWDLSFRNRYNHYYDNY